MILPSHYFPLYRASHRSTAGEAEMRSLHQVGLAISSFSWPRESAIDHIWIFARCDLNDHVWGYHETLPVASRLVCLDTPLNRSPRFRHRPTNEESDIRWPEGRSVSNHVDVHDSNPSLPDPCLRWDDVVTLEEKVRCCFRRMLMLCVGPHKIVQRLSAVSMTRPTFSTDERYFLSERGTTPKTTR
jgi:hypothetical protein